METAEDRGGVAIQNSQGRIMIHFLRPDLSGKTLCGRYGIDRIEPEYADVTGKENCQVCELAARRVFP